MSVRKTLCVIGEMSLFVDSKFVKFYVARKTVKNECFSSAEAPKEEKSGVSSENVKAMTKYILIGFPKRENCLFGTFIIV